MMHTDVHMFLSICGIYIDRRSEALPIQDEPKMVVLNSYKRARQVRQERTEHGGADWWSEQAEVKVKSSQR